MGSAASLVYCSVFSSPIDFKLLENTCFQVFFQQINTVRKECQIMRLMHHFRWQNSVHSSSNTSARMWTIRPLFKTWRSKFQAEINLLKAPSFIGKKPCYQLILWTSCPSLFIKLICGCHIRIACVVRLYFTMEICVRLLLQLSVIHPFPSSLLFVDFLRVYCTFQSLNQKDLKQLAERQHEGKEKSRKKDDSNWAPPLLVRLEWGCCVVPQRPLECCGKIHAILIGQLVATLGAV